MEAWRVRKSKAGEGELENEMVIELLLMSRGPGVGRALDHRVGGHAVQGVEHQQYYGVEDLFALHLVLDEIEEVHSQTVAYPYQTYTEEWKKYYYTYQ